MFLFTYSNSVCTCEFVCVCVRFQCSLSRCGVGKWVTQLGKCRQEFNFVFLVVTQLRAASCGCGGALVGAGLKLANRSRHC